MFEIDPMDNGADTDTGTSGEISISTRLWAALRQLFTRQGQEDARMMLGTPFTDAASEKQEATEIYDQAIKSMYKVK